jgi:two-component system LytT family response regulator
MRVLIAARESYERTMLLDLCHLHGDIGSVIAVESGKEALEKIRGNVTDVAFLACELEDMTGFDVLHALNGDARPAAIMLASDDRYAAEALSVAATDYVIHPVSPDRLALALKRAHLSTKPMVRRTAAKKVPTVEKAASAYEDYLPIGYGDRLVGERGGRLYFFSPLDIDYIEADSNYVQIHVRAEQYLSRDSMTRLSRLLGNIGFVRISRALLLNTQRVSFAQRQGRGVLAFELLSGERVLSSTGLRLESGTQLKLTRTRGMRRKNGPTDSKSKSGARNLRRHLSGVD